jgi:hypothetical protein
MAFDELFKEIGHTLEDTARDAIQTGKETLRQAVSRRVAESQFGQQVIADIKMAEISRMMPVIILVLVGIFFLGRTIR